ncbi:serine hydrolase [Spirosoma aerolatum]|uniref:serine hydrolase n=1 Tax=Spirosoma aerolatum TaxID=1211326 RepID=UPI0009ADBFBF|nr:serine hydrolase [Spirosoma aerolatum]
MKLSATVLLLLSTVSLWAQKPISSRQLQDFDGYVEAARKQWQVPGMAITVVKDNKVIFKKGYGVRELGKPEPVDTQTLFACASTTKAMTVTLLGILVDEGKLAWNDPVSKYLPELQLYDPYVTRELRVRDLLIHDTGIGSTDFMTGAMSIPANEMFLRMRLVKPSYSFRAGFAYQNTFYSAAGRIIERIAGKNWAEFLKERVFNPLGMTRTAPKRSYIKDDNQTRPHYAINDTIRVIDYGADSEIGSAGAVWSSADDISKWVNCMLDSSKYRGGRLLKPETWTEMFTPQTFFPEDEYPTMSVLKPNWRTYGLGWYQHDYKGHKVNFHTGSLAGLTAIIGQVPDEKLGVYIFGNLDHAEVRHALMYKTFDWFALGGNRDWSKELKIVYDGLKKKRKQAINEFYEDRIRNTSPVLPLASYAGTYTSPLYGKAVVSVQGDGLAVNINDNSLQANLAHWHYDIFYGPYQKAWYGKAQARFLFDKMGKVDKLLIDGLEFTKE